jgi:endonuclease/exonuclease/phosphatase family metal-dependent hydrolase
MRKSNCRRLILFVCTATLLCGLEASSQAKEWEVRVMSYNIHHANPPSAAGVINTDSVAGVITKNQPDVVALQEVDVNTSRSGKELDEAKAIADKARMHYRFAKAIDYAGGDYGIAILSKYAFDSFAIYKLPSGSPDAEARVLALGFFGKGKQVFAFACTHLDAGGENAGRLLQMKFIDSILGLVRVPLILAGDLNSEPANPVIGIMDKHFKRTCIDTCSYTFPSTSAKKTIDYIAVHRSVTAEIVEHKVLHEPFPSDHLPIMAIIKMKAGKMEYK